MNLLFSSLINDSLCFSLSALLLEKDTSVTEAGTDSGKHMHVIW